ncbi:MAG TPA: hypothetical protein VF046_08675 [Gemmatimonadales bacterium]
MPTAHSATLPGADAAALELPITRPARGAPVPPDRVRAALPGLTVAVFTVLFGFAMGGLFGFNEGIIKDRLAASAAAVTASVYGGDAAAAQPVITKSWDYMQRAHLHGGAVGTAAIGMIVVMLLIGAPSRTIRVLSLALGLGALGYSVFWMWAGFIAPGLGSTGAAKESLRWLAIPSAGAVLLGTAGVVALCAWATVRGRGLDR